MGYLEWIIFGVDQFKIDSTNISPLLPCNGRFLNFRKKNYRGREQIIFWICIDKIILFIDFWYKSATVPIIPERTAEKNIPLYVSHQKKNK